MSSNVNLKETTKVELRSVLVSCPGRLRLNQLDADYDRLVGHRIRYRDMGYNTLQEFLTSIPDVVHCFMSHGELMVEGVADEKTQHIASLVSRQRKRRQPRSVYSSRSRYDTSDRTRNNPVKTNFREPARPKLTPQINSPAYMVLRGQIKELLFAYTSGLKVSQFMDAFAKRFGQFIDLNVIGFETVVQLLESMTDLLDIKQLEDDDDDIDLLIIGKLTHRVQLSSHQEPDIVNNGDGRSVASDDSLLGIKNELKANVQKVLLAHPNGIKASKFAAEFQKITGKELSFQSLGFQTVLEFVAAMPKVVKWERPTAGDWLLFDVNASPRPNVAEQGSSASEKLLPKLMDASFDYRGVICNIVKDHPEGFLLSDLPNEFERCCGYKLEASVVGFMSLEELLWDMREMIDMKYQGEGRILLLMKKVQKRLEQPSQLSQLCVNLGIPQDSVLFGENFVMQTLPVVSEAWIQVRVSEINTPGDFWLQLNSDNRQFEKLMSDIQEYDRCAFDAYTMPLEIMCVGLSCAGRYVEGSQNEWHRCIITGFRDMFVELYYVDYGTTACTSKKNIRILRKKYMDLPAQAIKARLCHIQPPNGVWSENARVHFREMVRDSILMAQVVHVDESGTLSVILCDTRGVEDLFVNDSLVYENLAIRMIDEYEGDEVTAKGDAACAANNSRAFCTDLLSKLNLADVPHHHITRVQLTDEYTVHILTLEGKNYIACAEVSALLWKGDDILRHMLRQHGAKDISKLVLSIEEHPDIIKEMAELSVRGTTVDGELVQLIVVFELHSVLAILEKFNHPSTTLKTAVRKLLGYSENDPVLMKEEQLRAELEQLTARRKTLLRLLSGCEIRDQSKQMVDEISDVENKCRVVRDKIKSLQGSVSSIDSSSLCHAFANSAHAVSKTPPAVAKVEPAVRSHESSAHRTAKVAGHQRLSSQNGNAAASLPSVTSCGLLLGTNPALTSGTLPLLSLGAATNNLPLLMTQLMLAGATVQSQLMSEVLSNHLTPSGGALSANPNNQLLGGWSAVNANFLSENPLTAQPSSSSSMLLASSLLDPATLNRLAQGKSNNPQNK